MFSFDGLSLFLSLYSQYMNRRHSLSVILTGIANINSFTYLILTKKQDIDRKGGATTVRTHENYFPSITRSTHTHIHIAHTHFKRANQSRENCLSYILSTRSTRRKYAYSFQKEFQEEKNVNIIYNVDSRNKKLNKTYAIACYHTVKAHSFRIKMHKLCLNSNWYSYRSERMVSKIIEHITHL